MKKGTNPAQIIMIISELISENRDIEITNETFKNRVIDRYNSIYSITSKDTIIANLREDAMIHYQEEMFLTKLPQDGNKVDILGGKIENNCVKLIISQQKGNNASFNSTSFQKTLEKLQYFVDNSLVEQYFYLLPEDLNPTICELNYEVEVIIGMTIAFGAPIILDEKRNIKMYTGNDYLRKMGINNHNMIDLDMWCVNNDKVKNHSYNAISKCCDFDEIYNKCIEKLKV